MKQSTFVKIISCVLMWSIFCSIPTNTIAFGSETDESNGLINGDFENSNGSYPSNWHKGYFWHNDTTVSVVKEGVEEGSNCLKITNTKVNDATLEQEVKLKPNAPYTLYGWVKAENIEGTEGNYGLNVEAEDAAVIEKENTNLKGSTDWEQVKICFITTDEGKVTIRCRLGNLGSAVTGTAYFDNFEIIQGSYINKTKITGRNIDLYSDKNLISTTTDENVKNYMDTLDNAYDTYYDLVGRKPYGGEKLNITNDDDMPYWGLASTSIFICNHGLQESFEKFSANDDWSFGILHEMGHEFDIAKWNFDGEIMANFKMAYVLEKLNGNVNMARRVYTGNQIIDYYKTAADASYDNTIAKRIDKYSGDGIQYTNLRLKNVVGWDAFKKAFRKIDSQDICLDNQLDKYNYFLRTVQEEYNEGGSEVYDSFPDGELDYIRSLMNGNKKLESLKKDKIEELKNYKSEDIYNFEGVTKLREAVKKGTMNIGYSLNENEVNNALSEAKAVIDNIKVEAKQTVIYYKGYKKAYIHYKVGNGSWTKVPGVKMEESYDVDGFCYKITIDLKDANKLTACFNDGNGNWDSNNGKNYTFGEGYYTFKDGKIEKISKPAEREDTYVTVYYKGFSNPYIHYKIGSGNWTQVPGVKMEENHDVDGYNYKITINLKGATKLTACFNDGKGNWDSNSGKNYTFGVGSYCYKSGKIVKME